MLLWYSSKFNNQEKDSILIIIITHIWSSVLVQNNIEVTLSLIDADLWRFGSAVMNDFFFYKINDFEIYK